LIVYFCWPDFDLKNLYKGQLRSQVERLADLMQIIEIAKFPTLKEAVTGLTSLPDIPGELKDHLKFEWIRHPYPGQSGSDRLAFRQRENHGF